MATEGNAAAARMGKLKKEAEALGIEVHEEMTEPILREAIKQYKDALKPPAQDEPATAPATAAITKEDFLTLGKVIAESVTKANHSKDDEKSAETYAEPDPSEVGEFKTYYTPSSWWILPAKRIAGRIVHPPYGKIIFKLDRGQGVMVGTQWQTKYVSTFTTNNTKVQAFMESSPYFRRKFFLSEELATLTSDQVRHAEYFAKHLSALNNTMAPDLFRMGAELGCSMNHSMSLPTLRTVLSEKLAEHDMARYKEENERIMSSVGVESLLTLSQTK
jgi:hypothetical protein